MRFCADPQQNESQNGYLDSAVAIFLHQALDYSRWKKQLETFWSVFNKQFHQAQLHRPSLAAKILSLEIYIKD